jgi:hypothetical protein
MRIKAYVLKAPVLKAAASGVFLVWSAYCEGERACRTTSSRSWKANEHEELVSVDQYWECHIWCSIVCYCKLWNQDTIQIEYKY